MAGNEIFVHIATQYKHIASYIVLYSRLILRGKNFKVFVNLLYPHHKNFIKKFIGLFLKNKFVKSFYYPIHENFPPRN